MDTEARSSKPAARRKRAMRGLTMVVREFEGDQGCLPRLPSPLRGYVALTWTYLQSTSLQHRSQRRSCTTSRLTAPAVQLVQVAQRLRLPSSLQSPYCFQLSLAENQGLGSDSPQTAKHYQFS